MINKSHKGISGSGLDRPLAKTKRFQLSVTSDLSNLSIVASFISESARVGGLDQKQADQVEMAVDEAITNIIQHAYRGRRDGTINIWCERQGDDFVVEIHDRGLPFDPSKVRIPRTRGPLSQRTVGGLGIFFMRKLMDRVEFSPDAKQGNRLRMVKHLK